jgi:hypothetical protein
MLILLFPVGTMNVDFVGPSISPSDWQDQNRHIDSHDWGTGSAQDSDAKMGSAAQEHRSERTYDLIDRVTGLYRIMDLVDDVGSGSFGMDGNPRLSFSSDNSVVADKIIIDQTSLGRFINDLQFGAYVSQTEIDFNALDHIYVQPVGVYGSQSKIVEFMLSINAVDSETYVERWTKTSLLIHLSTGPMLSERRRTIPLVQRRPV